ncbi:MAG TPA: S8 family serine peptidase, partial [Xanthomonadaceae bacterium]|nr:S8 family serine peptidase [Xanthomonadaceae bacterium]
MSHVHSRRSVGRMLLGLAVSTILGTISLVPGQATAMTPEQEGLISRLPQDQGVLRDDDFLKGREAYYVQFQRGRSAEVEQAVRAQGGEITHRIDIIDAIAVILPPAAVQALERSSGVTLIEPVPEHSLASQVVPWNIDQYQAREIWDKDRDGIVDAGAPDGSALRFCIIDTGIYAGHSDFAGVNMTGLSQITGEQWFEDGNGHGTHVAGTANAVHNGFGVVGAMPGGAQLIILKIFNNNGVWVAGQSNLGAAAQACRDLGANVISMSLSGGSSATENNIFQALYDTNGMLNIAAAGNAGNTARAYPASYDSVISVAAIDRDEVVADFSQYPTTSYDPNNQPANAHWDVVELSGGGVNVLSTWPGPPGSFDGGVPRYQASVGGNTFDGGLIEGAALGEVSGPLVNGGLCTTGSGLPSWNGAVVICERGSVNFSEKINTVRNAGGLGAIIYNNVAGDFAGTCAGACTQPTIPAISLSRAQGLAMVADHLGQATTLVTDDGQDCAGCSGSYLAISGTSMATPGVAAAAAMIWNACGGPATVNNKQLRQLLRDTAKDLQGTKPGSGFVYGAGWDRASGWGLVKLADAQAEGVVRFAAGDCPISLSVTPNQFEVCSANQTSVQMDISLDARFSGTATLSTGSVPAGASGSFSANPLGPPPAISTFTLSGLGSLAGGSYGLEFLAVDDSNPGNTANGYAQVSLQPSLPASAPSTLVPSNGATQQILRPNLVWSSVSGAASYRLEISTLADFSSLVYEAEVSGTAHTPTRSLAANTTHYWRVRATNICGSTAYSATASFTTHAVQCQTFNGSTGNISDAHNAFGPQTTNFTLTSSLAGAVADVNVLGLRGTHASFSDLHFILRSPAGTNVWLMERSCGGTANFHLSLDDEAAGSPGGWPCPATDQGTYKPSSPLSSFFGQAANGTWTLAITDNLRPNSGTLQGWSLQICVPADPVANNPVPVLSSISPDSAMAGSGPITLTATGSNFMLGSRVRWNGTDRDTTFVNATTVTATIPAGDLTWAGTRDVTVFNPAPGGGTSAVRTFTIQPAHLINVTANPVAGGTASCSPNPVPNGGSSTCSASPASGYSFSGWSGACTGMTCAPTNVTGPLSVTANFVLDGGAVNGVCGGSHGGTFTSAPTTDLCDAGNASAVTGDG